MAHEFEIGTSKGTMTNLSALATPVTAPRSGYLPYAKTVRMGDGSMRGLGAPIAQWDFPLITLEERDMLKTFCTDLSTTIYIRTKLNDDTYADFSAVMHWPEKEERWMAGVKQSLSIRFTMLEALA
jgi:hypothetical protein